ncbi:hypothetical protein ACQ9ZF_08555 [Cetobacterium somerae]|jgi:hypothetical protein|uniref:hypothetical protein n=1 Tax=Cetobacterium somerae TaxID=188913 RepID=UPI003D76A141
MKILEISDRGIKLKEDGEIINQGLFSDENDIPYEVRELLSIYENSDEIILNIELSLDEEIIDEIKEILSQKKWKLKEQRLLSKKIKYVIIFLFIFEIIFCSVIYFKNLKLNDNILKLKKQNLYYKKNLSLIDKKLSEFYQEDETEIVFKKSEISDFLVFLSEICKQSNIKLEKAEFLDKKISINGYSLNNDNIFLLKKYMTSHKKIVSSKFDFIKKEGEIIYFLIELEIN